MIVLTGSNYFERNALSEQTGDDVWTVQSTNTCTWTRTSSRGITCVEVVVVVARRWRWPWDKLRHVCRAIKYMSGKSRGRYRSEAIVMVAHERRLELKEEGFRTKWSRESQGKTTKLYSFAVDGGPSIRRTVCPLFVVERYSYEKDGRRAANIQSLSRQRGAARIVVALLLRMFRY